LSGPFSVPNGNAVWTSLSGLRQAVLGVAQGQAFYYVDNITAWIESDTPFPTGWEETQGGIPDDIIDFVSEFDISGDGLIAWSPYYGSLYGVQDFTAPDATLDFEYTESFVSSASLDRDRAALVVNDGSNWSIVLVENVWSGSPTYTTVVNLADPDVSISDVSLSGPYLAYSMSYASGDNAIYYVDLTSVDDLTVDLPTPVQIQTPPALTDGDFTLDSVSIALTEMAISYFTYVSYSSFLATTRDFRTVTATNWTEFDEFPTGIANYAHIDISFPNWP